MGNYQIPADTVQTELEIKKSKFIAYIAHASSPEKAHQFIDSIRQQYPDARHVCWAYIAGEPNNTTQLSCSDDGEPSGTAGKPMLNVLQHSNVGEIVAVVVRYFGGIKLGTGGLVRAYSGAVNEALKIVATKERVALLSVTFTTPYPLEDWLRRTLEAHDVIIKQADYGEELILKCDCPEDQWEALSLTISNGGRGQVGVDIE